MTGNAAPADGCIDPGLEGCTGCFDTMAMWVVGVVVTVLCVRLTKNRWGSRGGR